MIILKVTLNCMDEYIIKLCKLAKIKFYKNAMKLTEKPVHNGGIYDSIECGIEYDDIFSKEDLIDNQYYFIQKCVINDMYPEYRTRFIKVLNEDYVKNYILSVVPKKLGTKLKNLEIHTYKGKDGKYIHYATFTSYENEQSIIYKVTGDRYDDSKIELLYMIYKYINHLKYVRSKESKKK